MDAKQLFDCVEKDGGFTYDLTSRELVTRGYAVSVVKGCEKVVPLADFTDKDIFEYVWQNWKELSEFGNCLGAWVDGGQVYLDISTVVDTPTTALRLAEENDQEAFYDLVCQKTVTVEQARLRKQVVHRVARTLWVDRAFKGSFVESQPEYDQNAIVLVRSVQTGCPPMERFVFSTLAEAEMILDTIVRTRNILRARS